MASRSTTIRRIVRRVRLLRLIVTLAAALLAIQAAVITVLALITKQRTRRLPPGGFPHLDLPEVAIGENRLEIYSYGEHLYDAMLEAIDNARETIYLETYLWKDDAVGRTFKERLIAKAAEGVAVYVIFDTFGNLVVPRAFKRFPPSIYVLPFWAIRRPWHVLDPRRYGLDHRKLLVVDGTTAFMGGYNIGKLYATQWRDTHMRICGPEAQELAQAFVDFWNRFCRKRERIMRDYPLRFNPMINVYGNDIARMIFPIRDMYIAAIDRAQHHIRLTNAYFIPDHILLESLEAAARRGVKIEILLPWRSNHMLADWAARSYFTRCLDAGIHLLGYQNAMVHAKTCTIDGQWSTIGTANLDRLSSLGNYEINIEIYDSRFAWQMEALFDSDKTNAIEITKERWQR
ncbi:MAG TPA: phospholipase D-like domain-containing protein, partial [Ktedonobacterales bacterium]|nr:phospholipase D-like domain-containing protein [Ktedonobacterales bacterium]